MAKSTLPNHVLHVRFAVLTAVNCGFWLYKMCCITWYMAPNILQKDGTKVGTNDPVTLHTTHNT